MQCIQIISGALPAVHPNIIVQWMRTLSSPHLLLRSLQSITNIHLCFASLYHLIFDAMFKCTEEKHWGHLSKKGNLLVAWKFNPKVMSSCGAFASWCCMWSHTCDPVCLELMAFLIGLHCKWDTVVHFQRNKQKDAGKFYEQITGFVLILYLLLTT